MPCQAESSNHFLPIDNSTSPSLCACLGIKSGMSLVIESVASLGIKHYRLDQRNGSSRRHRDQAWSSLLNSTSQNRTRARRGRRTSTTSPHGPNTSDILVRAAAVAIDALRAGHVVTVASWHRNCERDKGCECAIAGLVIAWEGAEEGGTGCRGRVR